MANILLIVLSVIFLPQLLYLIYLVRDVKSECERYKKNTEW